MDHKAEYIGPWRSASTDLRKNLTLPKPQTRVDVITTTYVKVFDLLADNVDWTKVRSYRETNGWIETDGQKPDWIPDDEKAEVLLDDDPQIYIWKVGGIVWNAGIKYVRTIGRYAELPNGVSEPTAEEDPSEMAEAKAAFERMNGWLRDVEFEDYTFIVKLDHRGQLYMRARYAEKDTYTGEPAVQTTRRWALTPPTTKSEFVQTCFKCILTSLEHRAREGFKYKERRVFGPHFDVDDLWALCEERENAGGRDGPPPAI